MDFHKIVRFLHEIMRTDVLVIDSEDQVAASAYSLKPPQFLKPLFSHAVQELKQYAQQLPSDVYGLYESPRLRLSFLVMGIWEDNKMMYTLSAGPFRKEPSTSRTAAEFLKRLELPQKYTEELYTFLQSIPFPVAQPTVMGQLMMNTCYAPFVDAHIEAFRELPLLDASRLADVPSAMQALSNTAYQYQLEEQMREAIRTGNETEALQSFYDMPTDFAYRLPDNPLRLRKNMCFVLATIARVAAIDGGASPQTVHTMSEQFFHLIERSDSLKEVNALQARIITDYCREVRRVRTENYSQNTRKIIDYLCLNFTSDFSLDDLAAAMNLHKNYLCRLFRKETGQTILEYLTDVRLQHAKYLLGATQLPVTDICFLCGFGSYLSFSRAFKAATGISCSQWRSAHSKK